MTQPYGQQPGNYGQQPGTPPGGYPQQGYQQSTGTPPGGYPQAGYPQGGYPQSAGYPQQGYPQAPSYAPGAGGLPQPPPEYGQGRSGPVDKPGSVTGAAVLGYIQAGITLITTGIIFFGLVSTGGSAEGWLIGLAQLVGIVLLIFGSVQLMSGTSRNLFIGAVVLEIVISLYYLIRVLAADTGGFKIAEDIQGGLAVIAVFFAIMPVIGLILALGSGTTQYVQAKRGY